MKNRYAAGGGSFLLRFYRLNNIFQGNHLGNRHIHGCSFVNVLLSDSSDITYSYVPLISSPLNGAHWNVMEAVKTIRKVNKDKISIVAKIP